MAERKDRGACELRLGRRYALGNKTLKIIQTNPTRISQHNSERWRRILFQNNHKATITRVHNGFDNILSDKLNPLPMKGDPLRKSLKPNTIPKKVTGQDEFHSDTKTEQTP